MPQAQYARLQKTHGLQEGLLLTSPGPVAGPRPAGTCSCRGDATTMRIDCCYQATSLGTAWQRCLSGLLKADAGTRRAHSLFRASTAALLRPIWSTGDRRRSNAFRVTVDVARPTLEGCTLDWSIKLSKVSKWLGKCWCSRALFRSSASQCVSLTLEDTTSSI